MFHKATKLLAKELDSRDWIPVRCLVDHNHFRVLCLVQRKSKIPWWQKCHYHKTDYELRDVLLPGQHTAQQVICDSDPFTVVDHVDGNLKGDASVVTDVVALEMATSANLSHAMSVKVQKRHASSQVLDSLNGKSKINSDHLLIKQSQKFQKDLYLITDCIEAMEAAEFRESNKTEGSILADVQVKLKFTGLKCSKRAVTIPKGCTLAFRVKRLLIRGESVGISIFQDDKTPTFGSGRYSYHEDGGSTPSKRRQAYFGGSWINQRECQLMEIEQECAPLLLLSTDLRGKVLNGFLAIITNSDLLEELELQLEQALDEINPMKLTTSRPELQELVDNLQDSTGAICRDIAEPVLYFLQALDEFSVSEFLLLEESVGRKIVSKQTALVRTILEKYFSNEEGKLITDTQEVSSFTEDELDITETMIELRGVTVQRSGASLTVTGNPDDDFLALSVLYVALHVLNLLSK